MLTSDAVHVWRATPDLEAARIEQCWETLAADERARAQRFRCPEDRARFVVARALLRTILASYLDEDARHLRFGYGWHGKPRLLDASGHDRLHFNVSHSGDMILLAIARDRDVGIDVEFMRPGLADEGLAQRFFAERECASLRALPGELWQEAFFRCWTRKEAYVKATGRGLDADLKGFAVSVMPGLPAAVLWARDDGDVAARWSLRDLVPGSGYIGAVAARGHGWRLERFAVG